MNLLSRRIKSLVLATLMAIMLAGASATAVAQEEQEYCDWYWGYKFVPAGGWEWWCWRPQVGWWYAESEDGKQKSIAPQVSSNTPLQFFTS